MKIKHSSDAEGFMAVEWILGIALIIIPVFLLTFSIMQYPPRKSLSQVVASESARAFVQESLYSNGLQAAQLTAERMIDEELGAGSYTKMNNKKTVVSVKSSPGDFCPGQNLTIEISIDLPFKLNPIGESKDAPASLKTISSIATERIDDYSEIDESSPCPDV